MQKVSKLPRKQSNPKQILPGSTKRIGKYALIALAADALTDAVTDAVTDALTDALTDADAKPVRERINIDDITEINSEYPQEFIEFYTKNNLTLYGNTSNQGKALSLMLHNPDKYFTREDCDKVFEKFGIKSNDSIQAFNKHEQKGIITSSQKGLYYIPVPYQLSSKHKMRKDFKFDGTDEERNCEIDRIKSTISHDYIEVPNELWQLGHKNPECCDNTSANLVLQPPIQQKYRDRYIFLDTLTKIPTPKTFIEMNEAGNCPFSEQQFLQLQKYFLTATYNGMGSN